MPEKFSYNQEFQFTPEQIERVKFLVQAFRNGLNDSDIVGYHGTSLESIIICKNLIF
jgi:hypothetical protein